MSLRHRLLAILAGFSIAATLVMDQVGSSILASAVRRIAGERLERESDLLARQLAPLYFGDPATLDRRAREAASDLAVRVTIVDGTGKVISDSSVPAADLPSVENHLQRPEIQQALARGAGKAERLSGTLGERHSYFARAIHGPDGRTGVLRLSLPTAELEAGVGTLRVLASLTVMASFLVLTALAYLLIGRVVRPMERIARAADRVASGGYEHSLAGSGGRGREVQALAASMDRMRRALLERVAQVAEQHKLLDTVLAGMREGLLVIDTNRRVILANAAIRRVLALGDAELAGRMMAEVIRDPEVGEAFSSTLTRRQMSRRRVDLAFPMERSFELVVEPLDAPDGEPVGAIGIFVDVTRLLALEQVRSTFVADLSHEMRTPLASIHAAIETIEDDRTMSEEERERFFGILRRNVERIRALIEDLTDLSRIETGAIPLDPESITLAEIVREVLGSLQSQAAEHGVTLVSKVTPDLRLNADRRRLDQILMNVVENAVKFNRPGGSVELSSELAGQEIRIRVADTGEGIPVADRERVFQRFYRVDRSRSRAAGGRGLGLAIVKHLMRLHGGTVHAEDNTGGGTVMVLTFPVTGPALDVKQAGAGQT